ncbi:MAG: hypothetical protein KF757_01315 [Phycisphaeraceae bacterium]|nr:hypothetical protein [Phycisphaeraceae bacterium]MCW5761848.1 hypothetical protein [Phycisphaeraceae bacterium]
MGSIRTSFWMLCVISACAVVSGCVSYSTYPEVKGLAPSNPNFIHVKPIVRESIKEIITQFHQDEFGTFAVNLPKGMTLEAQYSILDALDDRARLLTSQTLDRPIYHVGRIWVRGTHAKVDIVRPILELGPSPSDVVTYQGMTVWLEGGVYPWGVTRVQPWSIGVVSPPELNLLDEETPG